MALNLSMVEAYRERDFKLAKLSSRVSVLFNSGCMRQKYILFILSVEDMFISLLENVVFIIFYLI